MDAFTDFAIVTLLAMAGLGILMSTGSLSTSVKEDEESPNIDPN